MNGLPRGFRALISAAGRVRANARASYRHVRQLRAARVAQIDPAAVLHEEAVISNLAGEAPKVRIGANTHVRGALLVFAHGGEIAIGEWCYVGDGTRIWSAASVHIGDRVLISHGCEIHDCNAHPVGASARHRHFRDICTTGHPTDLPDVAALPVRIEPDVWIGFGSTILKGVTIGAKSIVAAKSLVTKDVPPGVVVAGSPAQLVRELTAEELE
jgi:acetyltransferase-like isoleucine patch superfamily enzyme